MKRAQDKESSLTDELEECQAQQTDIENNQLGKLKEASDEMLQAYNDNLEKCKVLYHISSLSVENVDIDMLFWWSQLNSSKLLAQQLHILPYLVHTKYSLIANYDT